MTTRPFRPAPFVILLLVLAWGGGGGGATARAQAMSFVRADGARFVDAHGSPVTLKGCNVGNWLMLEPWMFGGCLQAQDQAAIFAALRDRFGREKADRLLDLYRAGYVGPRDFDLIKSFGFNAIRLPFDYRLLQDDRPPYALKPDAFRWLDHALEMAEAAGVYVVLDLHGAPGGQSKDMPTGQADRNALWGSATNLDRTAAIWRAVADRYKDRAVVAAYDLLNEPYGDFKSDLRPDLATLMPRLYEAIRRADDRHVMFMPGALNGGIAFYGNPHDRGWHDVGFTEHYYPGLFGDKVALDSHARVLGQSFPLHKAYLDRLAVPYFVGEFNVVLESTGGAPMMREYYDRTAAYGWAATMWSYKLLRHEGGPVPGSAWQMVNNADPLPQLDLATSTYEQFEQFFTDLATMKLAVNEPLRHALTDANPPRLALAQYPALPTTAPASSPGVLPGWTSADIGAAAPGATTAGPDDGTVTITAGGTDIYGASDSFRFVSQPAHGRAEVTAQVVSLLDSGQYAKAGVMARWGDDDAGAAFAMVNVFPDGTVALATRAAPGAAATETKQSAHAVAPVELRLTIDAGKAEGFYRADAGPWVALGSSTVPTAPDFRTGLALCSHNADALTQATFRIGDAPPLADSREPSPSLLQNGSFEDPGDAEAAPAHWNRWGNGIARETAWVPTHSGACEIGYHHRETDGPADAGLWQDVTAEPGKRYTFTVYAQHDNPGGDAHDAQTVELRLETTVGDHQVTIDTASYDVSKLATGNAWTRLAVSGTAPAAPLRALIRIVPAKDAPRGGAIKLDDAALTPSATP